MLIIENSYNHKYSLGSLTSTAHQSFNNMLESQVLILEYTARKRKVTSELHCNNSPVANGIGKHICTHNLTTYIMLPNACYNSYYLYA